jgi:hypothetical protein
MAGVGHFPMLEVPATFNLLPAERFEVEAVQVSGDVRGG